MKKKRALLVIAIFVCLSREFEVVSGQFEENGINSEEFETDFVLSQDKGDTNVLMEELEDELRNFRKNQGRH